MDVNFLCLERKRNPCSFKSIYVSIHMHICYASYYIGIHAAMQWKDKPRDLDLHLLSFDNKTLDLVTHCFFANRGGDVDGVGLERGERLHLDRDDTKVCRVANFDFPRYCLQFLLDQVLTHLQGNGTETMTLGHKDNSLLINHQHTYVWMVHQYSGYSERDPDDGQMKDCGMSVAFSGMFQRTFDTPIPGPADSRWWLLVVAKLEDGSTLCVDEVNELLPLQNTGSSFRPNIAAILPYLKRS